MSNNIFNIIKNKINLIIKFYFEAIKNIDKEYNLILEKIIFSPKYNQKVPLIRLSGSGGYIIETAENILKHNKFKCHLHPDDLLIINKLYLDLQKSNANNLNKIVHEDLNNISGEIYFSDGEIINIYKPDLDTLDLNKLFSLPKKDAARLLEARGFKKARDISKELDDLKSSLKAYNVTSLRNAFKLIKN